jgi:hypothetical protein
MNPEENEQTQLLREILKWIKFAGMKEVKNTLIDALDTDAKKLVYQKSDGTKGTVKLAKLAGYRSNKTVDDLWDAWFKLSLGENIPVRGGSRFKRSFDLEDFGIEIPEIKTKSSTDVDKKNQTEAKAEGAMKG